MLHQGKDIKPGLAAAILKQAGIDPTRRGETLAIDEFVALARAVGEVSEA